MNKSIFKLIIIYMNSIKIKNLSYLLVVQTNHMIMYFKIKDPIHEIYFIGINEHKTCYI